jgi:glycosyltransferase involved in cell wall biosynthesis
VIAPLAGDAARTAGAPPFRLCLAGPYPRDPAAIGGGVDYIVYVLADTWGERPDVALYDVTPGKGRRGVEVVTRGNVTIHYVGVPASPLVPNLLAQQAPVAAVIRDLAPDVVNSHHIATTAAAVKAGVPVVHVIHGIEKREIRHKVGRARVAGMLQAALDQAWIGRADALASVCRYGLEQFARVGTVAWAPVEDVFFAVPPMRPSRRLVYAGVINRRKNLHALLAALPRVYAVEPGVRLSVCGPEGEADYAAEARALVARTGLADVVRFEGVVDRERLAALLADSVGLVLPSLQETAPVVIAQAMAAGRVALAAPAGGIAEMIDDGRTGFLIDPTDAEGLAARLLELVRDEARAAALGAAARAVALERHERHAAAERMLVACRGVARRHAARPA